MMSIIVTVQVNPWLTYKITMDRLHPYTRLHNTSYKTVPSQHGLPPRGAVSKEGILWLRIQMALTHRFPAINVLHISWRGF